MKQLYAETLAYRRRLELAIVVYTSQLVPAIKPVMKYVDVVSLWIWSGVDIEKIEANFKKYRCSPLTSRRCSASICGTGDAVLLDMVYLHCGPTAVFLAEHPDFVKRDAEGNVATAAWNFPALNWPIPNSASICGEIWNIGFGQFAHGFRCDVADGIPLDFWETARERLDKIRPDLCMLAEGTRREDQLKAFDLNYGWGFQWDNAASVRKQWEKMRDERPGGGARFIRFIDNHDIANDSYDNRIEKAWGTRRVNATLVALFTLDGVPMLYNGQEVADTARHSIFGRLPIDWSCGDKPAGQARRAFCKKLCAMRRAERR